jgi:transcriptional regulator with XRE-family HTH domain
MENIKEILAKNLKVLRRKKGLTQEKLAEKTGMSIQYLALLELAQKFPSGEMLERLANSLDVDTYKLLEVVSSANNELEILRNDIICEVKVLNETFVKDITREVTKVIKNSLAQKPRKIKSKANDEFL